MIRPESFRFFKNFGSLASLGLIQFIDNLYIVVNFLDAAGRVGIRTSWVCRLARLTAVYKVSNIRAVGGGIGRAEGDVHNKQRPSEVTQ